MVGFFFSWNFFYLGVELTVKGNQFKVSDHSNGLLCFVEVEMLSSKLSATDRSIYKLDKY